MNSFSYDSEFYRIHEKLIYFEDKIVDSLVF